MLIPNDKGQWRWNAGPWCDSKEEALATADIELTQDEQVHFMDCVETVELEEEDKPK